MVSPCCRGPSDAARPTGGWRRCGAVLSAFNASPRSSRSLTFSALYSAKTSVASVCRPSPPFTPSTLTFALFEASIKSGQVHTTLRNPVWFKTAPIPELEFSQDGFDSNCRLRWPRLVYAGERLPGGKRRCGAPSVIRKVRAKPNSAPTAANR